MEDLPEISTLSMSDKRGFAIFFDDDHTSLPVGISPNEGTLTFHRKMPWCIPGNKVIGFELVPHGDKFALGLKYKAVDGEAIICFGLTSDSRVVKAWIAEVNHLYSEEHRSACREMFLNGSLATCPIARDARQALEAAGIKTYGDLVNTAPEAIKSLKGCDVISVLHLRESCLQSLSS